MSSTLRLKREATGAIELRRSPFEIILDGESAGSIDRHQTVELAIEPGHHTLQVKTGRYSSPARTFDAADGMSIDAVPVNASRFGHADGNARAR